jgi:LuxR family maltose regulon positive regulatory protein
MLIPLINTLTEQYTPLLLVLDDYHLAATTASDATLLFLLEHMPNTLRLVILSRSEPALPLARWRVQGLLTEIRQEDLHFSEAEAELFLSHTMGLRLDAEQVATLAARTEGWIAGLQLAALSLHSQPDSATFIAHFAGNNRYIGDYLMGEVIHGQAPETPDFLLCTAILPHLCGALCDAVTGRDDGQAMLERIEDANLFIIALDQQQRWYRYHHLFAEMLCERLAQEKPALLRDCHARAAAWFAAQGETREAIEQALAGQAYPLAARLLETEAALMLQRGEVTTVLTWLRAFPTTLLDQHVRLALFATAIQLMYGDLEKATSMLQHLEAILPFTRTDATWQGELAAVRAFQVLVTHGDMPATQAFAQEALRYLPPEHGFLRDLASLLNASMMPLLTPGDLATTVELLTQIAQASIRRGNYPIASFALDNRALKEVSQGLLHQAEQTCQEALHLPLAPLLQEVPFTSWAYLRLGDVYREWNQLARAREVLEHGLAQSFALQYPEIAVDGYLALARVYHLLDERDRVQEIMRSFERLMQVNRIMPHTQWQVEACRARLFYAWGKTTEALRWSARYEEHLRQNRQQTPLALTSFSDFTLARLLLVQARYAEVSTLLERLLTAARTGGRGYAVIEVSLLLALVEQATEHANDALQRVMHALQLASTEGFVRLFLDEGQPMLNLLSHVLATRASTPEQRTATQYARFLLTQTGQDSATPRDVASLDILSEREMEILRLLATGKSNVAIAAELFLALSTVKWYIARLYNKLEVNTRTQAVARAHELKLLKE